MRRPQRPAFTIIELLVVIGVLGLLMGLLLPALGAAHRKGLKSSELNAIKQVGYAWQMYTISNKDQVLPGYLDAGVQQQWNVKYQHFDHSTVSPAPSYGSGLPNDAGPWPWRLMLQLGYSHDMVHGYIDEPEVDPTNISTDAAEVQQIAYEPGFGYNAMYVGGWWEMNGNIPRPRYFDANVVVRSVATIRRSTDLVIFCSSSMLAPGTYKKFNADQKGCHYVVPPWLGNVDQWTVSGIGGSGGADVNSIEVITQTAAPIGRYNRLAAVLFADLHQDSYAPGALHDMRKWIDAADSGGYHHQ